MSRSPARKPLEWSAVGVLALLGGVVVLGLAAGGASLLEALAALGFGAGVLLIAGLWQVTLRRAEAAGPLTGRERAWNVVVLVALLAVMAALGLWWATDREGMAWQGTTPSARPASEPEEQPGDADPGGSPAPRP